LAAKLAVRRLKTLICIVSLGEAGSATGFLIHVHIGESALWLASGGGASAGTEVK
jgi:hypothetical protein